MRTGAGAERVGVATLAYAIPTKGRHGELPRTLALAAACLDRDALILLCDQSPVPYAPAAPDPRITVLHRPDLNGLPAARNALLAASDADVVVFMDDDTDLAPGFTAALRACIARWPDAAGWGPVLETRGRAVRRIHRAVHLGCFHDPRRLTGAPLDGATGALFGACFAVRRVPALVTGFDARRPGYGLGEDLDFCRRHATHCGAPFRFVRGLRAIHRCAGANRADPLKRGKAKAEFLVWLARGHGRDNPVTILHLLLALLLAALGGGREPAAARGVLAGMRTWIG